MKITLPHRADMHCPRWLHRVLPWLALALLAFALTSLAAATQDTGSQGQALVKRYTT